MLVMNEKEKLTSFGFMLMLVAVVFYYGCGNSESIDGSKKTVAFSWDTLSINTQKNPLGMSDHPVIFNENGEEFYANYNNSTNSLVVYSIDKERFDRKVTFFSIGANKIDGLVRYIVWDSTVLRQNLNKINVINFSGEIEETFELIDLAPSLESTHSFTDGPGIKISNFMSLSLNSTTHSVVFSLFNKEDGYKNIFKEPTFIEFNVNTHEVTPHRVTFPDDIDKRFYGPLVYPNIISNGDSIIYNFPYKAAVYIYSKKTGKVVEKAFTAKNVSPVVAGLDLSEKGNNGLLINFLRGESYECITYDSYRNFYYMIYSQARVDDKPQQRHLVVFDNNISKIGEVELPEGLSPKYVISQKGLLFRNVKEESFDTLTLHVLSVEVEDK